MKKSTLVSTAAATIIVSLFAGCASIGDGNEVFPKSATNEEVVKLQTPMDTEKMQLARPGNELVVSGSFFQTHAYEAVKQLAAQGSLKVDTSFVPSEKYRITQDVNSSFGIFLKDLKIATGVDYRIRNGAIQVVNKDLVERSISGRACAIGSAPSVSISLKNPVPPAEIFNYFAQNYNMSFVYKTKFFDLTGGGEGGLAAAKNVSFQYQGCDPKEAFRTFLQANNLIAEETSPNSYNIMDYELATIDVPLYFDYTFTSTAGVGGGSTGGSTGGGSTGGSTGGASGGEVTTKESQKAELAKYIQKYLSSKGKVEVNQRGYITIEDTPDSVRVAKKLLTKEIAKQKPISLKVSILRIDVNDGTQIGVDWRAVSNQFSKTVDARFAYASSVAGGGSLTIGNSNLPTIINAVEKYGKTKVVRDYTAQTKSGILNSFKAVEQIPYVTTTTLATASGTQSNMEAKIAEAGVIINILPAIDGSGEMLDLSTSIVVSELVEMVTFNMSQGEFKLPKLATNEVKIPAKVYMDQTLILTGFKMAKNAGKKEGVPGLIRTPYLGWMFGTDDVSEAVAEFAIIITPTTLEEI